MPWVNRKVEENLTLLINQLCAFHEKFAKENRNDKEFEAIALSCDSLIDLIYGKEKPEKAADTMMSTASGVIQVQMDLILNLKKGKKDQQDFTRAFSNIKTILKGLSAEFDNCLKSEDFHLIEKPTTHALTHVDSLESLRNKIHSLRIAPLRHFTMWSLFSHAGHYYPKTLATAALCFTSGITSGGLDLLRRCSEEAINRFLSKEDTGLTPDAIIALASLTVAVSLTARAVYKSLPDHSSHKRDIEKGEDNEQQRPLLR